MIKPGFYNISNQEYHNNPEYDALSKGGIDRLLTSPAHFMQQKKDNPPSKEMVFGSAFHTLALEPERADKDVKVKKSVPVEKRNEKHKQGIALITEDERNVIEEMKSSLKKSETWHGLLDDSIIEESIFWQDRRGFLCKCRPDVRRPDLHLLADLKSCRSAHPDEFSKACANFNYDIQGAWYLSGINAVQDNFYQTFLFVCVEKTAPYAVAFYRADLEMLDNGRVKIKPALELYAECLKSDTWQGYPDRIDDIFLPRWALLN